MSILIAILLISLAIWLGVLMLMQGLSGKVEFLSVRNFFLLGFIIFQLGSGAIALAGPPTRDFRLLDPASSGQTFFFMVALFLGIFFLVYRRSWVASWLSRHTPVGTAAPAAASMLTLAFVFLGVGLVFRVVLIYIPIVGPAFFITGSGLLAVAAGMAAWVWGGRMFNPAIALATAAITLVALAGVLHTDFGRRAILGVIGCFGWGAYHGYWKHLGPKPVLMRLAAAGTAAMIVVAAFTATRSGSERDRSVMQKVTLAGKADLKEGIRLLLSGQDTGRNSIWIIENYPARHHYLTLHTARYFLTMPIPRMFYADKPDALGRITVPQANADRKRASNYSIGPGIIGHIAADNPYLALPLYAVFFGLFIGYLDRLIQLHPSNPFVILPIGTTLGQIVGFARGETGLFLFHAVLGIAATWICMYACAKVMAAFGWRMQTMAEDEYWSEHDGEDEWDHDGVYPELEYAGYDDDGRHQW